MFNLPPASGRGGEKTSCPLRLYIPKKVRLERTETFLYNYGNILPAELLHSLLIYGGSLISSGCLISRLAEKYHWNSLQPSSSFNPKRKEKQACVKTTCNSVAFHPLRGRSQQCVQFQNHCILIRFVQSNSWWIFCLLLSLWRAVLKKVSDESFLHSVTLNHPRWLTSNLFSCFKPAPQQFAHSGSFSVFLLRFILFDY